MVNTQEFRDNKYKGDIGEGIVKFLIDSMEADGWQCIPFGVETKVQALKESLKLVGGDTSIKIRCMPDFVAVNSKEKIAYFIESKSRSSKTDFWGFKAGTIHNYVNFWKESKIIMVYPEQPHFSVIEVKDIDIKKHYLNYHWTDKIPKELIHNWNFKEIQKDIKSLFPNLTDEQLKKAITIIPKDNKKQGTKED